MVLVHTKLSAHKGRDYGGILRSLGLYVRHHWIHHPKLAPKVIKEYPSLTEESVKAVLEFAQTAVKNEILINVKPHGPGV